MQNAPQQPGDRQAFTLVEMLVAIAIIGLLVALIFPTFVSARRKGYQAQCVSNLHQISKAFALYRSDWDGCWQAGPAFSGDYHHGWWPPLQPYIKGNRDILACPATVRNGKADAVSHIPGYALNSRLQTALATVNERDIPFPATTVELCDAPEEIPFTNRYDPWKDNIRRPDPLPDVSWERHLGGANYAFCDGHVKWYPPGMVLDDNNGVQNGTRPSFALKWRY